MKLSLRGSVATEAISLAGEGRYAALPVAHSGMKQAVFKEVGQNQGFDTKE